MKTAVQWYSEQLKDKLGQIVINQNWQLFDEIIEQAKEMEKEHIEDAVMYGIDINSKYTNNVQETAEQYYNETFKNQ
jgi:hypothetical protein